MIETAELLEAGGEFWELRRETGIYFCEAADCFDGATWYLRAAETEGVRFLCTRHAEAFFHLAPGTLGKD